jgi:hypothetical protein
MAYGVWCILSGQAWVPRKGSGLAPVSGSHAVTAGLCYILLAAYAYVDLDWRRRERLRRFRIPVLVVLGTAFSGLILFG